MLLVPFFVLQACSKEEIDLRELPPSQAILGKWEMIERGNWPNMRSYESSGYTEFRSDSIIRYYDYKQNQFTSHAVYWIDDSLLYEAYTREDGYQYVARTSHEFLKDKLRLNICYQATAITCDGIYKKIRGSESGGSRI